jgi:uncharacterized protein YkwD
MTACYIRVVGLILVALSLCMAGICRAPKQQVRSTAATTAIAAESFDAALMTRLVHEYTNRERSRRRLAPFDYLLQLQQVAEAHSRDMAEKHYFSHKSPGLFNKADLAERLRSASVSAVNYAENIAMLPISENYVGRPRSDGRGYDWEANNRTYDQLARAAVDLWMNSAGHRRNILNESLTSLGVGCWIGTQRGVPYVYFTQDFASFRPDPNGR